MKNRIYSISYLWGLVVLVALGFGSCSYGTSTDKPIDPQTDRESYVKIYVGLPDFDRPSSRAMNDAAEREIKTELLNILVFKVTGSGEIYEYTAPIKGSVSYDAQGRAMVTARLIRSQSADEKYRLVVLANADLSDAGLIRGTTEKQELLSRLDYELPGKWDAGANYTPFPMWGETVPMAILDSMPDVQIDLFRAVARIDVGLNFTPNGLSEEAGGLGNFKLKEINVYRTYDGGYLAPLVSNFLTTPSIPATASRRADTEPLQYTIADPAGADKYIREIYVPEADLPSAPANGNMHCLVVAGFYEGSTEVSYYRLDFAHESTMREYLPILRNHRYVFNIIQVRGPGFASPELALQSNPTVAPKVEYDLIVWDETIHEMEVQGRYYFGLDRRDLTFGFESTAEDPENQFRIKYQTNYPVSSSDPVTFSWENTAEPLFTAVWDESSREIGITANSHNGTGFDRGDVLTVHAGPFELKVNVRQKHINYNFTIDCETVVVSGTYVRSVNLGTNHYITLSITAEDRTIQGSKYIIETEDPNGSGITFRAEGEFDFSGIAEGMPLTMKDIKLTGSGKLTLPLDMDIFTLRIKSNSTTGSYCQATIRPVSQPLNIVVLASSIYRISNLDRGVAKVINSTNNFGPNDNSIVKTAGFNYVVVSGTDYPSASSDATKWITGTGNNGRIADIVYIAYSMLLNSTNAENLAAYMDKGGIVVAFIEDNSTASILANALFKTSGITATHRNAAGAVYPFPAHPKWGLDPDALDLVLRRLEGDPILNGSFGDVRDKQWGEDASSTTGVINLPGSEFLTVYSYANNINGSGSTFTDVTMFKYESEGRNMFWCGDGGFMSATDTPASAAGGTAYPFHWNTSTYFPTARPNYGPSQYTVYNSIVFCNAWAWAIERSEHFRAKRESYIN